MKALKNLILFIICLIGGCEATMAQTNGTNNNYIPANPGSTLLQGYWYNLNDTTAITGRQLRGYAGGGKSVRVALWADVLQLVGAGASVTPSNTVTFTNKDLSSSTNIFPNNWLPLTGGTLTGSLIGTNITINGNGTNGTSWLSIKATPLATLLPTPTAGNMVIGVLGSNNIALRNQNGGGTTLTFQQDATTHQYLFPYTSFQTRVVVRTDSTGLSTDSILVTRNGISRKISSISSQLAPYMLLPSSPSTNDALRYNGSTWINSPILANNGIIWTPSTWTMSADTTTLQTIANFFPKGDTRWLKSSTAIPTAANPSATIGLTANNGSASTFMRSDATPALLQSIVPTWTGLHTYSPTIAANTVVDGIYLNDITAATSGNQQYSPGIHWHGNGWKTNSTAASQSVDFRSYVIPIQGTTNTTANLVFESSINGGAYGNQSLITSDGKIRAGNALNAGTDISLSAVLSNQSVIQSWWGLQLSGNTQTSAATYTPAQVGTARQDYHVVIPMVQTGAAGLAVLGVGSQTGNYFEITSNTNKTTSHGDLLSFNSAGSLGIGTTSPDASAIQDIASTTKGILFPRMTTTQQNAISSPATGLQIFNTTFNTPANYNGTGWRIPAVINQVAPTNGQMIFGNGADFTVATPSVANGITYTPGTGSGTFGLGTLSGLTGITSGGTINFSSLTASKIVFTDASKNLTSTAPGTSSQYFAGDGSLQTAYVNPMTTLGDIIYGGASGVQTRLPGNTTSTQKFLTQTGTGLASAIPAYFDLFGSNNTWGGNNTFSGTLNSNSGINLKGAFGASFYNSGNTFSTLLYNSGSTANYNIALPNATGTLFLKPTGLTTQYVDGTGALQSIPTGVPSGSDGQIVGYYDGGIPIAIGRLNMANAYSYFTPSTGGTVNLVNNNYNIINPSGALVSLTVNLPSSPADGDVVEIKYTQNITTVTYANGTVVDGITAPTAGGLVKLLYSSASSSWY